MADKPSRSGRGSALRNIDDAIRARYPVSTSKETRAIRSNVFDFITSGLAEGWDIALIKKTSGRTRIRVLKLVERPRSAGFLTEADAEER